MNLQLAAATKPIHTNQEAEQVFIDYLIWSVAHDQDPHTLYDDPIKVFREDFQQKVA
jgi:hypothetical protein